MFQQTILFRTPVKTRPFSPPRLNGLLFICFYYCSSTHTQSMRALGDMVFAFSTPFHVSVNVTVSNFAPEGQRNDLGVQKTEFYFMGSARKSGTNWD